MAAPSSARPSRSVDPLYQQVFGTMNEADIATLSSLNTGATVDDGALCSALRGLYDAVLRLPPADALLFARYDVTP